MSALKRTICALLALLMLTASLTACGSKEPDPVNTKTGSFDEMVAYLTAKGYIDKDAQPVDINTAEGYVVDNTGGDFAVCQIADKACDYDGLWLFWWDTANPTDNYAHFEYIAANSGTITIMGGAAFLETAAYSGSFAIAFAEDYAKADDVLADFNALPKT